MRQSDIPRLICDKTSNGVRLSSSSYGGRTKYGNCFKGTKKTIAELEEQIPELEQEVEDLQDDKDALEQELEELRG